MRIVLLITMGIERPSGVRYFNIARELVHRGHSVRILALHPDLENCSQRRFIQDGVQIWYVGQMHARKIAGRTERWNALMLLRVLVMATLGMIWGIVCSPADVYHLGKPQPINGLAALIGCLLLRGQRFYVDCDDDEVESNRLTADWQRMVFGFWQWLLPRIAIGVTVNTYFLLERMHSYGLKRVVLVPNGVNLYEFRPPEISVIDGLREALKLTGRPVVAYVGTIALHNHPVDLLVEAFEQIAATQREPVLLLIGGGEDLCVVRRRVQELGLEQQVRFTGHIPRSSVPAYLVLATISVDPVHDNDVARARSPLKIAESLALGVPILTGNVGDRIWMLGDAGWVTAAGDAKALAQRLEQLLTKPREIQAASKAAITEVKKYSWDHLVNNWIEIYNPSGSHAVMYRPANNK